MAPRQEIALMLQSGVSQAEIARQLGMAKSTVSWHARNLGKPIDERGARRYDWGAVQAYVNEGHSLRECRERFGFARQAWAKAVRSGRLSPKNRPGFVEILSIEEVAQRGRSPHNLKRRLLKAGLLRDECYICGIKEWLGQRLVLHLDHVNGDGDDHDLGNLRMLCPNCHSQTETYCGRNIRLQRRRAMTG